MTDERSGGMWSLDPDTRAALRLDRIRRAMDAAAWDEAILEAEEMLDEEPNHPEALYLLGGATLELGDAVVARLALEQAIRLGFDAPDVLCALAVARFEACDIVGAVEAAREAIRQDPAQAEAHWTLGLALAWLPDAGAESIGSMSAARQLDPTRFPFPLELTQADWEAAIRDALTQVRPVVGQFWQGLPVELHARPDLEELRTSIPVLPPTVSGLFSGKLPEGADPLTRRPEAMRLFRDNLCLCRDRDELVHQIGLALESEAMGWMGVEDPAELG